MQTTERRIDLDPPPRRSPRLFGHMDGAARERPSDRRRSKLTEGQRNRLARDIAIYQSIEAGMSQRVAAKAFGLSQPRILTIYRDMACRKSRV